LGVGSDRIGCTGEKQVGKALHSRNGKSGPKVRKVSGNWQSTKKIGAGFIEQRRGGRSIISCAPENTRSQPKIFSLIERGGREFKTEGKNWGKAEEIETISV